MVLAISQSSVQCTTRRRAALLGATPTVSKLLLQACLQVARWPTPAAGSGDSVDLTQAVDTQAAATGPPSFQMLKSMAQYHQDRLPVAQD